MAYTWQKPAADQGPIMYLLKKSREKNPALYRGKIRIHHEENAFKEPLNAI